jgi:T-complex protein 1 subunit beta
MFPNSTDAAQFRQDLFNIARTTLSSKVLSQDKEYFANLAVDAVLRLKVRYHRYICPEY